MQEKYLPPFTKWTFRLVSQYLLKHCAKRHQYGKKAMAQ